MQPFEKELLKNNSYFVETPLLTEEVNRVIDLEASQREALMVYSLAPVGKNIAFKNALNKLEGNKIFINFNDLSYMSSFPCYYIVKTIYDKLDEYGIAHQGDFPYTPPSNSHLDVETDYDILLGVLKTDLYCLKLDKPLYILISNCDMPFDNDFSLTFYRHFIFDKRRLPDNLHVFLITSDITQVEANKEYIETYSLEGNKDNPKLFFKDLMGKYGRNVDDELLLLANPSLKISDYIYIAGFVINYVGLKEYHYTLSSLLSKNNTDEILLYIFTDFYSRLSRNGKIIFTESLLDLYMFNFGLTSEEILSSGKYLFSNDEDNHRLMDYEEISKNEKNIILTSLEFFTRKEDNRFVVFDRIIKEFIGTNAMYFTKLICDEYKNRLSDAVEHIYQNTEYLEKIDYRYFAEEYMGNHTLKVDKKSYFIHLEKEGVYSKKNIARYAIFIPLINRIKTHISKFPIHLTNLDIKSISENEIFMLSYIERASVIYLSGLDYGAFYSLFKNKDLMYFLLAKSRRMVRRVLNRFIDTQYEYHKKIDAGKGDISSSLGTLLCSEFDYLSDDKDDIHLREELLLLLGEVLYENDILVNGKVKDNFYKYTTDPITDFAIVSNNNSEPIKCLNDFIESLREEVIHFEDLSSDLVYYCQKYQDEENVFHKLIYAYLALKIYMVLGENRQVNHKLSSLLEPVMSDVLIYCEYCYFPEVYGSIYALFGRIYPKDYLGRMTIGANFLISQGYRKTANDFIRAIKYFSSLKIKEGE